MSQSRAVSIVTGATSGIGRATARQLAQRGHSVVLVGRREALLQEVASEIAALDPSAPRPMVMAADVTDPASAARVIDEAERTFGRIDALVNNAGDAAVVPIDQSDRELFERMFAVNVYGPAALISRAWPVFKRQRGGRVVNVSSMASADPFPGFFAYAAAKSAVESLARSCAKEGASMGVRACAVAPGAVETPLLRGMFPPTKLPAAMCLSPEEVARVIAGFVAGERDQESGKTIYLRKQGEAVIERVA